MTRQANAIDISEFQNPYVFDYQAVKAAGIDTLIIRAGYHLWQDKYVKEHIANAKKYGFKWHLYHYWMNGGTEIEWAIQNAKNLGLTSKQYFFLDMEDKSLPADWNGQFAQFRKEAAQSFQVGLYTSDSPYRNKFSDSQLQQLGVMRWIAAYSYEPANYDIWQMSGAGSGGFGNYHNDVDRDYVANSNLNSYAETVEPVKPEEKPFAPPIDLPISIKNIVLQDMVVNGIRGLGCSPDNGVTNRIYWTILGRKYYQEDGDRIWPFLIDKVKAVQSGSLSVSWDDIQNKPDVALKSDIPEPQDLSDYVTKEELPQEPDLSGYALKKDIPSLTGYAKLTDIPSVTGLVKESELDNYALKKDIPTIPDLSGYATVSSLVDYAKKTDLPDLTSYALKTDIPTSMAWQNITDKPDVATKSDIPTSIDWNSVTNKPDLATSAGLPKDLVHTTDLDKTNQKVSNVESTANQALSAAANGQSIATDAQNEAQSVSEKVETLTNQLNSANQVRTITSGTLADLANKNGQYHYEIDCIPSDLPSGVYDWGMCDVTVGSNYAKEVFTVTGANDNNGRVFVRVRGYGSSAWNDWREVTLWS